MLKDIINLGTSDDNDLELNRKIKITNQVAMLIGVVVAIPFIVVSLIHFKAITFIPVIGLLICGVVLLINKLKAYNLARVVMSLLPFILATLYNAYLTPEGSTSVVATSLIQLSFAALPFILFSLKEKNYLYGCALFSLFILTFGQGFLNNLLELPLDSTVIREGYLHTLSTFIAVFCLYVIIYVLSANNLRAEEESKKLVDQMNSKNSTLHESENELKRKIKEIEESQKEETKRNWVTQGISQFNNLLRSDRSAQELYEQIVYDLTKYIEANQCWLFLVNEKDNETALELSACYAYDRHKYLEKTVSPGQGLLGQAFIEQQHIYLEEVPDNYVNITSGLGKALPRCILIMPLMINEKVEGVFEIASFNKMDEHVISFVQELGETIASFISVNKINAKTKNLLEQTQEQTEQMKAQEEEMRQNMEELAATQEEMQRKEQEYVNRIKELEEQLQIS